LFAMWHVFIRTPINTSYESGAQPGGGAMRHLPPSIRKLNQNFSNEVGRIILFCKWWGPKRHSNDLHWYYHNLQCMWLNETIIQGWATMEGHIENFIATGGGMYYIALKTLTKTFYIS